ncbi:DUF6443 domain-containing protein, partial [Draconibacterium sp. IB214405]|uniref:DUF6443 domain-containing protein n=1 Tax=Draconibacterium sp. IB214405 TaxID=3097352 RepID=UPI002A162DCC
SYNTGETAPVVQYYDGFGRPIEVVQVKASQNGADMIGLQTYDYHGRDDKQYLLYAKNSNNGAFVTTSTFASSQSTFLSSIYGSTDGSKGYAQTEYEPSALSRPVKQGAPGASWQLDNNPVIVNYKTNSTAISSWRYTGSSYSSVSFPAESLFLTETTDEDGKVSKQYSDFEGKLVQTEINGLRTAYCYDEHGLLRAVVQPKGSSPASTSSCFLYKYDDKNRMVEKWIPGKGWEYFVYDDRNRVVLTQDGNLNTADKWQYTIYDGLNRPTEQGIWSSTSSRETLANAVESNIDYMEGRTSRVAYKYLSYDDYSMSDEIALGSDAGTLGESQASDNTGRLTMEKTILLDYESGMDPWITTTYYYDKYGRLIQTAKDNHLMGKDYITNAYNFAGLVEQSRYRHTADGTTTYVDQYTDYDHRGRIMKVRHRINGGTEVLLTGNNYNEAGSLVDKYLHSVSNGTFLQRMDYSYNIRGWLIQINSPTSFTENDKFGMQLYYNSSPSGGSAMYNGNISGINWGTPSNTNMLYRFTYDGINRLTNADFYNSSYSSYALDASYGYDNNGNLVDINRRNSSGTYIDQIDITYTGNQVSTIKDLSGDASSTVDYPGSSTAQSFTYDANGNVTHENHKLTITDYNLLNLPREINWSGQNKYVNYFYTFDGEKLRKTVENSGTITKMDYCGIFVYETNSGTRSLKYIITPEGRAVKNGSSWDYEYNLKDHLGNVRAVIDDSGVLVQERHYYPFGMEMSSLSSGSSTNNYQYNGKELENDFDLGYYDYGARFYDPALGRFHTQDLLSEKYYFQSSYAYAANNPILFIDWLGMEPKVKGPYSGRAYVRNNGTVVVYRITTSQRVMANITKQAIYSTGWLGIGLSFAESLGAFDGKGMAQTTLGAGMKFGEDVSREASKQAIVGPNRGLFAKTSSVFGKMGTGYSIYQVARAATDNTPTQAEALHSATFNLTEKFQDGNVNIANPALMEFSNGENSESVENHMNAIYNTLEQNLSGFDLTTNKGVKEANNYLNDNLDQIVRQVNQMLKDDEQQ